MLWRAAAGNSPATAAPWRVEICQERLSEICIYIYIDIDITMYIMYIYIIIYTYIICFSLYMVYVF